MNLIHGTVVFLSDWVVNRLQLCCSRLTGDELVNAVNLAVAIILPSLRKLE